MALAEPGRAEHGAGAVIPGYGHVSMGLVHPDLWGRGLRCRLLKGLHERASERGWSRTTPMDPGVERACSTHVRMPGISKVRP